MTSVAFFDVDHTLLNGFTGFYTTMMLIRRGILKKRRIPLALFYQAVGPFIQGANLKKIYRIAMNDMAGSSLKDILTIGRECFEKWIRPRLYQEGVDLVEEHKKKNHPVYLLTSGPYMTVHFLGEFLGADTRYSVGPTVDQKGILTRELRGTICYREGKVVAAEDALKRHGGRWEDAYYYGDSKDDLFILEKVGHPHLVNPKSGLRKIGEKKGWPILKFEKCLF